MREALWLQQQTDRHIKMQNEQMVQFLRDPEVQQRYYDEVKERILEQTEQEHYDLLNDRIKHIFE